MKPDEEPCPVWVHVVTSLDRPRAAGSRRGGGPGVGASRASPVTSIFHKPHDVRFYNHFRPFCGERRPRLHLGYTRP